MATWQFDADLIPAPSVTDATGRVPERLTSTAFDAQNWLEERQIDPSALDWLSRRLPLLKAWRRSIRQWGEEDGNRIDAVIEGNRVVEVTVRFDARQIDAGFVELVEELCRTLDCLLVTEELEVVQPQMDALVKEIRNSRAHRFVVDPGPFLEHLSDEPDEAS